MVQVCSTFHYIRTVKRKILQSFDLLLVVPISAIFGLISISYIWYWKLHANFKTVFYSIFHFVSWSLIEEA